jgi:hypothetical protein
VEGKFSLKCGQAHDLSVRLAFESHPCVAARPKIESQMRSKELLHEQNESGAREIACKEGKAPAGSGLTANIDIN